MKRNTAIAVIVSTMCAAACVWAITLHATGHAAEAVEFVKWAGGGLMTLVCVLLFFGGLS